MGGRDGATIGLSRLHHPVLTLGPGRRIGIWFQGCSIRCPGCMARDTWDTSPEGEMVALSSLTEWIDDVVAAGAADEALDGVTISGGEPFDQPDALAALLGWLRRRFNPASVDLLVYTGYRRVVVERDHADVLRHIDVLVTEPYRRDAGPGRRWRGSANQQMIPLTALGRQRYADHVGAPGDAGVQVDVRSGGLHLIGVPRPGEINRLEKALADRGVVLEDCSWST